MKIFIIPLILSVLLIAERSFSQDNQNLLGNKDSLAITQNDKLVYFVENTADDRNQFLVPFIEDELKALKDKRDTINKGNLFGDVKSLNVLMSGEKTSQDFIHTIRTFNNNNIQFDTNTDWIKEDTLIVRKLINRDWFLKVNINTLNNLIEYQFVLFKIEKTPGKLPFLNSENYRTTSIFIDPSLPDYKNKIKTALRQVFTEANEAPVPYIMYKDHLAGDTIFAEHGHILLSADASDPDSSPDQLKFQWEIPDCAYSKKIYRSGRSVDIFCDGVGFMSVLLTVSDGVNTIPELLTINLLSKPTITVWPPDDTQSADFYNSTNFLYTFHGFFNANDFSGLFNIRPKLERSERKTYRYKNNSDWPILIPKVRLATTVHRKDEINFFSTKFKVAEDSVINYREKAIPLWSDTSQFLQITDRFLNYRLKLDTIQPSKGYSTDIYTLYNNNSRSQKIRVPSLQSFKITADDHGIRNSDRFQIQFYKISRIAPIVDETLYLGLEKLAGHYRNFFSVGAGLKYFLFPQFSLEASAGLLNTTSSPDSVYYGGHSSVPFYYKIRANGYILNFKNAVRAFLTVSDLHRETFYFYNNNIGYGAYHSRIGYGLTLQAPNINTYHYEPCTGELFFSVYPKNANFSTNNIEIGIKAIINIRHE